jgi:hypothetical protein
LNAAIDQRAREHKSLARAAAMPEVPGRCAAETAVTALVCSRCGAPIVGQPSVVADTVVADTVVADTVVGAVSDAAGRAVPAGAAGQALPEPVGPGSGGSLPVELRLVLVGYVGFACAWFAGTLACVAAFASFFSLATISPPTVRTGGCSSWPSRRFLLRLRCWLCLRLWMAFKR